mmetsp:Transcript_8295/g.37065  ORF Transcript_8295/g.37065 Transcript_8295/m.37065 type:complete len:88 (+) Transcript_8295:1149-1412(+)
MQLRERDGNRSAVFRMNVDDEPVRQIVQLKKPQNLASTLKLKNELVDNGRFFHHRPAEGMTMFQVLQDLPNFTQELLVLGVFIVHVT